MMGGGGGCEPEERRNRGKSAAVCEAARECFPEVPMLSRPSARLWLERAAQVVCVCGEGERVKIAADMNEVGGVFFLFL